MVRGWDPAQKKAIVGKSKSETKQVKLDYSDAAGELFNKFFLPPGSPTSPSRS